MSALDPSIATKLAKICSLLGSHHDGERSAAAHAATKLLRAQGLSWEDVFTPALPAPPQWPVHREPTYQASVMSHAAKVRHARRYPERLTNWEVTFLADLGRCRSLSPKQAVALDRIMAKVPLAGGA
jgi:hypothetical protein